MADLGVLVTIANLYNLAPSTGFIKNVSVTVGPLKGLTESLLETPDFNIIEKYQPSGYYRVGTVGKYLSTDVRDYALYGIGDPEQDGVIITLTMYDKDERPRKPAEKKKPVSMYFHREGTPTFKEIMKSLRYKK